MILVPTCFGFGSPNPPKSRLGGVLGRLGASWGVLERLGGVLGASWSALERLRAVLERLGGVLGASWDQLRRSELLRTANSSPARAGREGVGGG